MYVFVPLLLFKACKKVDRHFHKQKNRNHPVYGNEFVQFFRNFQSTNILLSCNGFKFVKLNFFTMFMQVFTEHTIYVLFDYYYWFTQSYLK